MKTANERWTTQQEAVLAHLWGKIPAARVGGIMRRSVSALECRASKLGLRSELAKHARRDRFKGAEFYQWVLDEFRTKPRRQIARECGVSDGTAASWITRAYKYRDEGRLACNSQKA